MANKDVGRGWGDLNGSLTVWHCPKCIKDYPVKDWSIIQGDINGHDMDGRKCPSCDFKAFQHGETTAMIPSSEVFRA